MFTSAKFSLWFLKIGLAAVFLWFGIDKFLHSTYWLNAWMPAGFLSFLARFNVSGNQFIILTGIFEILTGVSLLTGILTRAFSLLTVIFLVSIFFVAPLNEVIIRDLGLIGGFLAVLFWPNRLRSI